MARLFAAQRSSAENQLLQNVLVSDAGPRQFDPAGSKRYFQTQVRHDGRHHGLIIQLAPRFHIVRQYPHRRVAINQIAVSINEQRAIRVAVKRHTEIGAFCHDSALQAFDMQRPAIQIYVAAIGLIIYGDDASAQTAEEFRPQLKSGPVSAIANHCQVIEREITRYVMLKIIKVAVPQLARRFVVGGAHAGTTGPAAGGPDLHGAGLEPRERP